MKKKIREFLTWTRVSSPLNTRQDFYSGGTGEEFTFPMSRIILAANGRGLGTNLFSGVLLRSN